MRNRTKLESLQGVRAGFRGCVREQDKTPDCLPSPIPDMNTSPHLHLHLHNTHGNTLLFFNSCRQ
jgi:hypothetical protein